MVCAYNTVYIIHREQKIRTMLCVYGWLIWGSQQHVAIYFDLVYPYYRPPTPTPYLSPYSISLTILVLLDCYPFVVCRPNQTKPVRNYPGNLPFLEREVSTLIYDILDP